MARNVSSVTSTPIPPSSSSEAPVSQATNQTMSLMSMTQNAASSSNGPSAIGDLSAPPVVRSASNSSTGLGHPPVPSPSNLARQTSINRAMPGPANRRQYSSVPQQQNRSAEDTWQLNLSIEERQEVRRHLRQSYINNIPEKNFDALLDVVVALDEKKLFAHAKSRGAYFGSAIAYDNIVQTQRKALTGQLGVLSNLERTRSAMVLDESAKKRTAATTIDNPTMKKNKN